LRADPPRTCAPRGASSTASPTARSRVMQRIAISLVRLHPGRAVTVAGFVRTVRDQKRMQFAVVADRTGAVQVTHARRGDDDALASAAAALRPGTAVAVTGEVVVDARIRAGGVEIRAHEVRAEPAAARIPVDASSSPDLRLDHRWLDLWRPEQLLVFEVQT